MNTIAINYAACIKQEAHWGYDKFHNICTGTWNTVNWGSMDWTHVIIGFTFAAAFVGMCVAIVGGVVAAERAQADMMKKFAF